MTMTATATTQTTPTTVPPQPPVTFEQLVDREYVVVRNYLRCKVGTSEDADELTQDVFMRAWASWRSFDCRYPRAWLFRIATNAALDLLRRRMVLPFVRVDDLPVALTPCDSADVERTVETLDVLASVGAHVNEYPLRYRQAFAMAADGYTLQEIADVAGVPYSAAKSLMYRLRQRTGYPLCSGVRGRGVATVSDARSQ